MSDNQDKKINLIKYYALNNKVVLDLGLVSQEPTCETNSLILFLSTKIRLHDLKYFSKYPQLVRELLTAVIGQNNCVEKL